MGLIVDTSEFITLERRGGSPLDLLSSYGKDQEYGVSGMTVAELQHGVRRADGERRRKHRGLFLYDLLDTFRVIPFTVEIAIRVGDLDAHPQTIGDRVVLADLIIAATALQWSFSVATRNTRHFARVPGLHLAQTL